MSEMIERAIQSVKSAETMAPAGSHEQVALVKAALYSAWPAIQAHFAQQGALTSLGTASPAQSASAANSEP